MSARRWKPQVLDPRPPSENDPIVKEVRKRLAQGVPAQQVRMMIGRRGLDAETIEEVLGLAATCRQSICTHCFCVCSAIVRSCPDYGREMAPAGAVAASRPKVPARLRIDYDPLVKQMPQITADGEQLGAHPE